MTKKSTQRRGAARRTVAHLHPPAFVGAAENGNNVVLVTLTAEGEVLDRRGVDLTHDLPTHPHHHEGSWAVGRYLDSPWARAVTLEEALSLVERVRLAAEEGARDALAEVQNAVSVAITCIALRQYPELPPTAEACIRDHRAQTYADSVLYRQALARAARARGWSVVWYDPTTVFEDAAAATGRPTVTPLLGQMGKTLGPPWQAKHKLAAAAALAASGRQ